MGGKTIMCEMDTEQIIEEIKRLKQENTELKGQIDGYKRALDIIGSSLSEHLSPTAWGLMYRSCFNEQKNVYGKCTWSF